MEIEWYSYWRAMYVVMFAMLFHALNNALSAFGTFTHNRFILLTSIIIRQDQENIYKSNDDLSSLRCIVWFITLAGAIVICLYGVEESDMLIKELDVIFKRIIYSWDEDPRASRIMIQIQEYVGCCGAAGNR